MDDLKTLEVRAVYAKYRDVMLHRQRSVIEQLPSTPASRALIEHFQPICFERFEARAEAMNLRNQWTEFVDLLRLSEIHADAKSL